MTIESIEHHSFMGRDVFSHGHDEGVSLNNELLLVKFIVNLILYIKWRPPILSELTLMVFDTGLTHSKYKLLKLSKFLM